MVAKGARPGLAIMRALCCRGPVARQEGASTLAAGLTYRAFMEP